VFIIGKKGATSRSCAALSKMTDSEVHLNIVEVRKPESTQRWSLSHRPAA
jgi:ribosomal protein S3